MTCLCWRGMPGAAKACHERLDALQALCRDMLWDVVQDALQRHALPGLCALPGALGLGHLQL